MTDIGELLREEAAALRVVGMDQHAALLDTLAYTADLRAAERQALHRLCETLLTALGEILQHVPGAEDRREMFAAMTAMLAKARAFGLDEKERLN
jgi:hypothetical protein